MQDEFTKQEPGLKQLIQNTVAESARTSFEKFETTAKAIIPQLMQRAPTEICSKLQPIPVPPLVPQPVQPVQPVPPPQLVPPPPPVMQTFTLAQTSEINMVERLKELLVAETPELANKVFQIITPNLLRKSLTITINYYTNFKK